MVCALIVYDDLSKELLHMADVSTTEDLQEETYPGDVFILGCWSVQQN